MKNTVDENVITPPGPLEDDDEEEDVDVPEFPTYLYPVNPDTVPTAPEAPVMIKNIMNQTGKEIFPSAAIIIRE